MGGFDEVVDGGAPTQDAETARGVGTHFHAGAVTGQFAERADDLGPHEDEDIDYLVVGVGEFALDAGAHTPYRRPEAGLDIPGQVEVHQPVGGADLDFGIVVLRGQDQRIEAALRADLGDLPYGLDTHVSGLVLQQFLEPRNGAGAGLGDLADVLGTDVSSLRRCLGRQQGGRSQEEKGRWTEAHILMLSRRTEQRRLLCFIMNPAERLAGANWRHR